MSKRKLFTTIATVTINKNKKKVDDYDERLALRQY